jgi:phenylalanyl-tRNA synthetase alpha subunit
VTNSDRGAWKTAKLKPYNFKAKGALTPSGALHPLMKVRHEFRQIFFEMGFEEMPTNHFVETGFWNFDALCKIRSTFQILSRRINPDLSRQQPK